MIEALGNYARFASGLPGFLRRPLSLEDSRRVLLQGAAQREASFLQIVERSVFQRPESAYRALFSRAGIELGEVAGLVRTCGLEGSLERLRAAGVYLTLDEFKGRKPIRRRGLSRAAQDEEFDNPTLKGHLAGGTGGSSGSSRKTIFDFDLLAHDAAYQAVFLAAFGLAERPMAIWRPAPPGTAGIFRLLLQAKLGRPIEQWFSHNDIRLRRSSWPSFLSTRYTVAASRYLLGAATQLTHLPLGEAVTAARWLAEKTRTGIPAHFDTNVSSGVRVCAAAKEYGLDIGKTVFRLGGEPLTPTKAELIRGMGCEVSCHYLMAEAGTLAVGCADPEAADDMHLAEDKVAVITRKKRVGGAKVDALYVTALHPSTPKIMINVEIGDYGVIRDRDCRCPFGALGFQRHIYHVRSYEKLTTEGIQFVGSDLLTLIEEVLPQRVGGNATDYQFEEEERDGLTRVCLVVSPRVGVVDDEMARRVVLEALGSFSDASRMMAEHWRQADTLRVVRREPVATAESKIMPLRGRSLRMKRTA